MTAPIRTRADMLLDWEIEPQDSIDEILRRSVWGPPRRLMSLLGDACGCAALFALLWLGLAILT